MLVVQCINTSQLETLQETTACVCVCVLQGRRVAAVTGDGSHVLHTATRRRQRAQQRLQRARATPAAQPAANLTAFTLNSVAPTEACRIVHTCILIDLCKGHRI